jgi:5,6-dimethylbenzimidazole synthase
MDASHARKEGPVFDTAFGEKLTELLRWRRDVRHFRPDPVSPDLLIHLLDLANLAPSVGLSQPWRFVTVDEPHRRSAVRADFEACNHLALSSQSTDRGSLYARLKLAGLDQAPCHLAVFVDPDPEQGHGLGRTTMPETLAYSTVMAVHTLWLAARAAGLGLGWVSIINPDIIKAILDVPERWRLIGYFCIGYPADDFDVPELEVAGWESRQAVRHLRR